MSVEQDSKLQNGNNKQSHKIYDDNIFDVLNQEIALSEKVKYLISRIEKNKPFENQIGSYQVKDLIAENAKSGTAFLLITESGKKFKLRISYDVDEIAQIDSLINKHKGTMPGYLGRKDIGKCSCFLFDWLEDADILDNFDRGCYVTENGEQEPNEIYKKSGKILGKINEVSMSREGALFDRYLSKILVRLQEYFSPDEYKKVSMFVEQMLQNTNLRYGDDLWDSHGGNFMLEEKNIHKAYVIDEGSIKENHLIGAGFGGYIQNFSSEAEVRKLLAGYFKKNPNMYFNRKYLEFIYAFRILRKMKKKSLEGDYEVVSNLKNRLFVLIEGSKQNITFYKNKPKFGGLYSFLKVMPEFITKDEFFKGKL